MYRLNNEDDFFNIGGDEYFGKGICIIEWGEIIKNALPKNTIFVELKRNEENENYRTITISNFH